MRTAPFATVPAVPPADAGRGRPAAGPAAARPRRGPAGGQRRAAGGPGLRRRARAPDRRTPESGSTPGSSSSASWSTRPRCRARCARPPRDDARAVRRRGSTRSTSTPTSRPAGRPARARRSSPSATTTCCAGSTPGRIWFWEDGGRGVHLTGANPPAFGVARIGPVYTPREHRGRGLRQRRGGGGVAAIVLAQGARACLFTDQANPTSNRIYEALGYRPVVDMANVVLRWGRGPTPPLDSSRDELSTRFRSNADARLGRDLRRGRGRPAVPLARDQARAVAWTGSGRSPSCSATRSAPTRSST